MARGKHGTTFEISAQRKNPVSIFRVPSLCFSTFVPLGPVFGGGVTGRATGFGATFGGGGAFFTTGAGAAFLAPAGPAASGAAPPKRNSRCVPSRNAFGLGGGGDGLAALAPMPKKPPVDAAAGFAGTGLN